MIALFCRMCITGYFQEAFYILHEQRTVEEQNVFKPISDIHIWFSGINVCSERVYKTGPELDTWSAFLLGGVMNELRRQGLNGSYALVFMVYFVKVYYVFCFAW